MKINQEVVRTRCQEIEDSLERLKNIKKVGESRFLKDNDLQDIACYRLLVAIEAALNLCYHIAAKELKKVPQEYAQCFQLLEEAKMISSRLSKKLQHMARFRNLLVHMYWKINFQEVFSIIENDLADLSRFVRKINNLYYQG
jgi:uncharacterized protein YutE (UPF0331/DUF86 family)